MRRKAWPWCVAVVVVCVGIGATPVWEASARAGPARRRGPQAASILGPGDWEEEKPKYTVFVGSYKAEFSRQIAEVRASVGKAAAKSTAATSAYNQAKAAHEAAEKEVERAEKSLKAAEQARQAAKGDAARKRADEDIKQAREDLKQWRTKAAELELKLPGLKSKAEKAKRSHEGAKETLAEWNAVKPPAPGEIRLTALIRKGTGQLELLDGSTWTGPPFGDCTVGPQLKLLGIISDDPVGIRNAEGKTVGRIFLGSYEPRTQTVRGGWNSVGEASPFGGCNIGGKWEAKVVEGPYFGD